MSKLQIDLDIQARETGKHASRALRRDRKVPAIVYGATKNQNFYIEEKTIVRYNVRAYENALFNLKAADGKAGIVALMKQVVVHPLTRRPQHVDFIALDLTKTVKVNVEIRVEGKAIGIADGGLVNIVNRTIEIECLPTAIPEHFTVDISNMGVGDAIHVSDLKLPESVKVTSPLDMTIVVVNLQEEEVIAAPTVDAAAATPAAGAAAPAAAGAATPAKAAPAKAAPAKDKK